MQRYKIVYLTPSINNGIITTDDLGKQTEYLEGKEELHKRLQQLIDQGHSPVYREVDQNGNELR